jgi:RNAse (barnase) inhibitor barstar
MKTVILDAGNWESLVDFYESLVKTLGAPSWHGYSLDAVVDSVVWHGCNEIKPPYVIQIRNLSKAPSSVIQEVNLLRHTLIESRAEHVVRQGRDVEVSIEIVGRERLISAGPGGLTM